jgi:hypothetical protein
VLRWLLVLALSLASSRALAQHAGQGAPEAGRAQPVPALPGGGVRAPPPPPIVVSSARAPRAARFAHVAAIAGVVSAGLLLGGSVAIAVVDDPGSERVTRGVQLGFTALAAPCVAFAAYRARRGAFLSEGRRVRTLGWAAYAGAIALIVAQWYGAFHDAETSPGLTVAGGALGALSVLPQAWDAYLSARQARMRSLRLSASGLTLRF